jgi:signal peptidase II
MLQKKSVRWTLFIACAIFLIDFFSKALIQDFAKESPQSLPVVLVENFFGIQLQIAYAINSGAAWGIFSDYPELLVIFRIVLICVLTGYLFFYNTRTSWQIPLSCIIAGALGNIADYFQHGYVIDMIQMIFWGYEYPVFNIADSAIFIGAMWLLTLAFFEKP